MSNQVIKTKVKRLTLDSEIVTSVTPTKVELTSTITDSNKIHIANIKINDSVTSIYAPPHQDISHKLDKIEFSSVSSDFLTQDDLNEYAKESQLPGYATENKEGLIKIGYIDNTIDKKYAVKVDENGNAFVQVPWAGGSAKDVAVDDDTIKKSDDETFSIYVNRVPVEKISNFNEAVTEILNSKKASDTEFGVIKTGFTEQIESKQYPVKLDNDGNAFVQVPWVDTQLDLGNIIDDYSIKIENDKLKVGEILSSQVNDLTQTITDVVDISEIDIKKVVFKEQFVFSGNYTLGLIKPDITSTYTVNANTSLYDVLTAAFCGEIPDADPKITYPSITLTVPNFTNIKVGDKLTPSYSISFDPGKYTTTLAGKTKTQDTGVTISNCEVKFYVGNDLQETLTSQSGTFNQYEVIDTSKLKIEAKITYTDGVIAKTFNEKDTNIKIESRTISKSKECTPIEEIIKCYAGTFDSLDEITGLTDDNLKNKMIHNYKELPEENEIVIDYDKKGIVYYVLNTLNVKSIELGESQVLGINPEYKTEKYDCFIIFDPDIGISVNKETLKFK